MPPNFSTTWEDERRRAQAVGHSPQPAPHPAVPSSPQPPPCSRYTAPSASLRLPAPFLPSGGASCPLLSSPLLQCSFPSCLSLLFPSTEAAARQGAGAASCCRASSNNLERQRRVRAHLPEIKLLGRNLEFIPPPTAASSISSLQLPEVRSPQL